MTSGWCGGTGVPRESSRGGTGRTGGELRATIRNFALPAPTRRTGEAEPHLFADYPLRGESLAGAASMAKRRTMQSNPGARGSPEALARPQPAAGKRVHFSFLMPGGRSVIFRASWGHHMARTKSSFVCQSCGAVTARRVGRCESCGDWNTIVEEIVDSGVGAGPKPAVAGGRPALLVPLSGETESAARVETGLAALDRVTGGGF